MTEVRAAAEKFFSEMKETYPSFDEKKYQCLYNVVEKGGFEPEDVPILLESFFIIYGEIKPIREVAKRVFSEAKENYPEFDEQIWEPLVKFFEEKDYHPYIVRLFLRYHLNHCGWLDLKKKPTKKRPKRTNRAKREKRAKSAAGLTWLLTLFQKL